MIGGEPKLRAIVDHFYDLALREMEIAEPLRLGLMGNFYKIADWLRNN